MDNVATVLEVLKAARQEEILLARRDHEHGNWIRCEERTYKVNCLSYVIDLLTNQWYLDKEAEHFGIKPGEGR